MGFDPVLLKQLIETFKSELDEQLQTIIAGLLQLEKGIDNETEWNKTIEAIFRSAHNIKGTARSLSIHAIAEIAHKIESLFSGIQKKQIVIESSMINCCLEATDKMQQAMQAFIAEEELSFDLNELLNRLEKYLNTETALSSQAQKPQKSVVSKKPANKSLSGSQGIESIRVSVNKIEKLSALMEELQVKKISADDYYAEFSQVVEHMKAFIHIWKPAANEFNQHNKYAQLQDTISEMNASLNKLKNTMRVNVKSFDLLNSIIQDEIRSLRLVRISTILGNMPRYVRDLGVELNKKIDLNIIGDEVKADKLILEQLKDPLMHLIRNAIDHGIEAAETRVQKNKPETGQIKIVIQEMNNQLAIQIKDDGVGIDINQIKKTAIQKHVLSESEAEKRTPAELLQLIFKPGFSTKEIITDLSGRGVGLDVVKTNLSNINGNISIQSEGNVGTTFTLTVPLSLTSEKGLHVSSGGQPFIIPINYVEKVLVLTLEQIFNVEGAQAVIVDNKTIPLQTLTTVLGLEQQHLPDVRKLSIVIIKKDNQRLALLVDEIIGEREIVIKALQPPLQNINYIAGGTLTGNNQVILILNPSDLIHSAFNLSDDVHLIQQEQTKEVATLPILVVDDSITTRTLEKNILESRNFQVTVAVNGKEAWDILQKQQFSLVITDVTMPIMDGFTLTERIKQDQKLKKIPVIIVTSLGSDTEKKRGIDAGADAYIVKNEFESGTLLEIVEQLL